MKRQTFLLGLATFCGCAKADDEIIKPKGDPTDPGPKPRRNNQGTYDCMFESMKRGQVTETQRARRLIRWANPVKEVWQGFVYWAIELEYEATTIFGKPETTVRALIRWGDVDLWLYVGSNELVP